MTGVSYGGYDLPWILHALTVDTTNDRLIVRARGVLAVEEYLFARLPHVPPGVFPPRPCGRPKTCWLPCSGGLCADR
ncbi:hypothetical protein J8C02_04800 [Chloracidobacterium sp. MS 40/45]|uniref:hypothetical protein n=1 Tax=Chloracidobacterium aggregatum TaxID=2851959 RepID=UPI001B8CDB7B|nr:hypothetical protein [Chloracidobacterium aggregatum]QUW00817.1 hypothetical protein J8C02_04800 [Chloracidobacterium sp. MS 40/45]